MSQRERLVIVGAGMAAGRLVDELLRHGYPGHVTVIGEEQRAAYNRVLLPAFVSGSCDADTLAGQAAGWSAQTVKCVLNRRASTIDADGVVHLEDGQSVPFDRLVLAIGAGVPVPDLPGRDLPGVVTLRSLTDGERLRAMAGNGPVVVVGGGLLGLEAAQSLLDLGCTVSVVHRQSWLLNRQLDPAGAELLQRTLQARGMTFHLGAAPVAMLGENRLRGVRLDDGAVLDAATVLFAVGTRADGALAASAGIDWQDGVIVDPGLRTSHPRIFAVGECARVDGARYTLVEPVYRQAAVLAEVLCGASAHFQPAPSVTRLKVSGIELFSAGPVNDDSVPAADRVCVSDPGRGLYRRLNFRDSRLVSAVLLGDIAGSGSIQTFIGNRTEAPHGLRAGLAFGLAPSVDTSQGAGT